MCSKIRYVCQETLPIVLMIGLIPFVLNDYILTALYVSIIIVALLIKREKHDLLILSVGFFIMILSETFFITTGVETFLRHSLFGIMPLWLPFLWAYAFIVMRRALAILVI